MHKWKIWGIQISFYNAVSNIPLFMCLTEKNLSTVYDAKKKHELMIWLVINMMTWWNAAFWVVNKMSTWISFYKPTDFFNNFLLFFIDPLRITIEISWFTKHIQILPHYWITSKRHIKINNKLCDDTDIKKNIIIVNSAIRLYQRIHSK